ncbi:MAG: hypothetical protein HZA22_04085 [Nitrospirae bacterium]|nr:hypothetical protein [Nitrospirota bacterium]
MPFEEYGFLGKDAEFYANDIYKTHKDYFDLCYEVNNFVQKEKHQFEPPDDDGQKVIAACLFVRVLNGYQAGVILSKRGLVIESEIMIRSVFESLVYLKNCCSDSGFFKKYIQQDTIRRLKIMNVVVKNYPDDAVFTELRDFANGGEIDRLNSEIASNSIVKLKIDQLARNVGMMHHYDTVYRVMCDSVHSNVKSLEKYICTQDGELNMIDFGPNYTETRFTLVTLVDLMLMALRDIYRLYELEEVNNIDKFIEKLNQLTEALDASWKPSTP